MRMIDADALIALVQDSTILGDGFKYAFVALVKGEPTVDAVPVVRCADCKFMEHAVNGKGKHGYCCSNSDSPVDNNRWLEPDWYCADGERRENDGND